MQVSATFISQVTNAVTEEVTAWQNLPLDSLWSTWMPWWSVAGLQARYRINRCTWALGTNMDGEKDLLGLWMAQTEGAKFWLSVMRELKNRGLQDMSIACVDGLKGFPESIEAVYQKTQVQLCIVHRVRHSLRYVRTHRPVHGFPSCAGGGCERGQHLVGHP